jgi:hypothetical protein
MHLICFFFVFVYLMYSHSVAIGYLRLEQITYKTGYLSCYSDKTTGWLAEEVLLDS